MWCKPTIQPVLLFLTKHWMHRSELFEQMSSAVQLLERTAFWFYVCEGFVGWIKKVSLGEWSQNMQKCRYGEEIHEPVLDLSAALPAFLTLQLHFCVSLRFKEPLSAAGRGLGTSVRLDTQRIPVCWHPFTIKRSFLQSFQLVLCIWQLLSLTKQQSSTRGKQVSCTTPRWRMS